MIKTRVHRAAEGGERECNVRGRQNAVTKYRVPAGIIEHLRVILARPLMYKEIQLRFLSDHSTRQHE